MHRIQSLTLLVVLAGAALAHAQAPEDFADPETGLGHTLITDESGNELPDPAVSPPEPPPLPPPEPTWPPLFPGNPSGPLVPKTIANPAQAPEPTEVTFSGDRDQRLLRIGMSLLFGAGSGALGGLAGNFLGPRIFTADALPPLGPAWLGASIGFALAVPIGTLLAGFLFDGDGAWWAGVLGDLCGSALGALVLAFGGGYEALPVAGLVVLSSTIVGYELTSSPSRVHAAISPAPHGGVTAGVSGVF